ncbi:MAG: tyrosine-type recombinase/integrase [Dehalococcoidia bacterium]
MPGNIRARSRGVWEVSYELSPDPSDGTRRRRYLTVRGTRKDADRVLTEALHQRDTGFEILPGRITLAQFLARWLRDYAAVNVAPSTLARYTIATNRHLVPHLGSLQLSAVRPAHVQSLHATCLAEGVSARTVTQHHRILSEALKHAVRWQLIPANPATAISPPRFERHEMQTLSPTQVEHLLTTAEGTYLRPLVYLAVHTGARNGELLAVRWTDLDLEHGRLSITRTAQRIPGRGIVFASPKTHRSRRPIALSATAVVILREHRAAQLEHRLAVGPAWEDHGLVFCQPNGRPHEPGQVSKAFARLISRTQLPHVRFHDLRHTAATLLLSAGQNPKVVSERLGHASVNITLDTYSHVLPNLQREAADAMDRILAPNRPRIAH